MPTRVRKTAAALVAATATGDAWFAAQGWAPFPFQHEVWQALAQGRSGLLHATTGSGKTYAVWFGALARAAALAPSPSPTPRRHAPPLTVLWITPMRALAADTVRALQRPLPGLALPWTVGLRTGDTAPAERARQERRLPTALVTTPESLTLLLTRPRHLGALAGVQTLIVDEWHELIGNKRGVQVQLAIARLKRLNPGLAVWGLSATLGNLEEAMHTLVGTPPAGAPPPALVRGRIDKALVVDTLLPQEPGRFSWGGHLGAQMLAPVVDEIASSSTTLVFTNVRSQAEIWYQLILEARPEWAGEIALHHGSLDPGVRAWVEAGLKEGRLKAVVATSSLDLGVDFLPVERVLQIGSAKGVARLLQRAGRSGHAPGRASRITLVPTNTLELVEAVAARRAALVGRVEQRRSPRKPLDVLVQHLVTVALGGDTVMAAEAAVAADKAPKADEAEGAAQGAGFAAEPRPGGGGCGFTADALFDEVRVAPAYAGLTREEFDWCLDFVVQGGASLQAYPEYHRLQVVKDEAEGGAPRFQVEDRGIAQRHRLGIGTIVSDAAMQVKWLASGGTIGTIEEGFISRLNAGDCFVFAGRLLEYVRTRELTAYVRKPEKRHKGVVAVWNGSKMPLSSELADTVLEVLQDVREGRRGEPELQAAGRMLDTQLALSKLPTPGELLVERLQSREGHHLFVYPFGGRHVHLGLGSLLAWRLSRAQPNSFSISINDHGFELLSALPLDLAPLLDASAFDAGELLHDVLASLNAGALARQRFREIARVAGLVFNGYPGAPKSLRQLQASSSLFWEVFRKYDAGNLLLGQAESEVLAQELELGRLAAVLQRMAAQRIELVELEMPSPFALPLMVERFREQLSTEKMADRLARILDAAARRLGDPSPAGDDAPTLADTEAAPPRRARNRSGLRPVPRVRRSRSA